MLFFDLFRNDPKMITVKAGHELFREGDPGDVMYVLVTGEAIVLIGDLVLENVRQGAILGEMAVVDKSPRSTTVRANTDCTFTAIDQRRFQFLVDESPRFAIEVMKVMAQRLRQCDLNLARAVGAHQGPSTAA